MEIQALLVEGGAILLQHFLDEGLWDEIHVEHSPMVLGDGVKAPQIVESFVPRIERVLGVEIYHYKSDENLS